MKAVAGCDITEEETEFDVDAVDFDKILKKILKQC